MRKAKTRRLLAALVLAVLFVTVWQAGAFVLLLVNGKGAPISWRKNDFPLTYIINERFNRVIPGADEAIARGFESWEEEASGARISFEQDATQESKRLFDILDTETHLVVTDPTGFWGLFGSSQSGTVSISLLLTQGSRFVDADMLFNTRDFTFSVDETPGTIDIESVAAHEAGHWIGLNHTPVAGATMYPFLEPEQTFRRDLSSDDRQGAIALYGRSVRIGRGSIRGRILNTEGKKVERANVVALNQLGFVHSTTLSERNGKFEIRDLTNGGYTIYADPLDGPVTVEEIIERSQFNLQFPVNTSFSTTFFGGNRDPFTIVVRDGLRTDIGDLVVGVATPDFDAPAASPSVLELLAGSAGMLTVASAPGASIEQAVVVGSPTAGVFVDGILGSPSVDLMVTVSEGVDEGLADIFFDDAEGRRTILTGVVDITGGPRILVTFPRAGSTAGGTEVTLTGLRFQDGALVTVGGTPTLDPPTVENEFTMSFTTPRGTGSAEIVVHNPDGTRGRPLTPFEYVDAPDPTLTSAAPPRGSGDGNETIALMGSGFMSSARVFFDVDPETGLGGLESPSVQLISPNELSVVTPPGPLGEVNTLVVNPDLSVALGRVFTFVKRVASGTTVKAVIRRPGQEDLLEMDVLSDLLLTLILEADEDSNLLPKIVVRDSSGTTLISTDRDDLEFDENFVVDKGSAVRIRRWPAPATETLEIGVTGKDNTIGLYELRVTARIASEDTKLKLPRDPPFVLGSPITFEALEDTKLSGSLKVGKQDTGRIEIDSFMGPSGPVPLDQGVEISTDGKTLKFDKLELPEFGTYTLNLVPAPGTSGVLTGTLRFKAPKLKVLIDES